MKIIFITNIISMHQIGLWDGFTSFLTKEDSFYYLATSDLNRERIKMGYKETKRPYIYKTRSFSNRELNEILANVDIAIFAECHDKRIKKVLKTARTVYLMSEHLNKKNDIITKLLMLKNKLKYSMNHQLDNISIFCCSSHAKEDYSYLGVSEDHFYKFGYFPTLALNRDEKNFHTVKMLWVGRMVDWKHPEHALYLLNVLRNKLPCSLEFVGDGPCLKKTQEICKKLGLESLVIFNGFVDHDKIINKMNNCNLYVFSSDKNEGWGVVLNEAMASGCICVCSSLAGSTKYLCKNDVNSFVYDGTIQDLSRIADLIINTNTKKIESMSKNAIKTIENEWSSEVASKRLYEFLLKGDDNLFDSGVLSKD